MKLEDIIGEPLALLLPFRLHQLVLLILITFLFLIIAKKKKIGGGRRPNLPPGPPKLPIIGNLHQLGALAHRSFHQLSTKYGPLMLLQLGNVPTLVVSSPDAARQLLSTNDVHCCSRPPSAATGRLSYSYADVAFSPYGREWKELRKLCTLKLLSPKRVQSFRSIREEEVGRMIESIIISISSSSSSPSDRELAVNLSEKMTTLATSILCSVALGRRFREREDYGELTAELHLVIREAFQVLGSFWAADLFPRYYYVGWLIDSSRGLHGKLEKAFRGFDLLFQKLIDDHLHPHPHLRTSTNHDEDDHLIHVLLQELMEDQTHTSLRITHHHIKAILMDIFVGGIDTTSITVVWAMAELARQPKLMKKAQDEIRECVGNKGSVSESDVDQLQYLKMVVKESLRLHPPGSLLVPRESISKFNINGYEILPKTHIQVNIWAIGRDPDSWENPHHFYPERFANSPTDIGIDFNRNFEFIPFGWGRRGCPGRYMGILSVELALANLLYHFDWKLPNGMKPQDINMEETPGLANYKKQPLLLVPIKHYKPS